MTFARSPYTGPSSGLVLAIDIGTTYSGVSYALLDPGNVPEIKSIGRFLDNCKIGNFKIPSVMFYDNDGNFRGVTGTIGDDEAEDLHRVEWWKLKLSSRELPAIARKYVTPDLPKGKSLPDIFADFIRYMFDSAREFIKESEPMGDKIWDRVKSDIHLILSHPNGWEGRQQEFLRKSVVKASIFTEEEALSRVSFVTEGEATFNFCMTDTKSGALLEPGHKVVVVDVGGGTIDVSSYTVNSTSPLQVEELHEPKCFYQGGDIVTTRAMAHAESRLKGSRFDSKQDLEVLRENFDAGLKTNFSENTKSHHLKFGSPREHDPGCGVKNGKLALQGNQVEKFFEPSVDAIVKGITGAAAQADPEMTFVFLAGGFAASPWIFQEVKHIIGVQGLKVSRPDMTNKAVAFGAISHYLDHFVVGRIVRYTYGTRVSVAFKPSDPEHRKRAQKAFLGATGLWLDGVLSTSLLKGTRISGTQEFREKIARFSQILPTAAEVFEVPIFRYTGESKKLQWVDEEEENIKKLAHISVDGGKVPCNLGVTLLGLPIFIQEYEIVYIFGETELKAQVAWKEGGAEKRSDVAILYDEE